MRIGRFVFAKDRSQKSFRGMLGHSCLDELWRASNVLVTANGRENQGIVRCRPGATRDSVQPVGKCEVADLDLYQPSA